MAFCINCGNQVPDGAKFCHVCGTPVVAVPSATPDPEPVNEEPVVEGPVVEPGPEPVVEETVVEPAPEPVAKEPVLENPQGHPTINGKVYTGYPENYVAPQPAPGPVPQQQAAPQKQQQAPQSKKPAKAQKPPKAPKQPKQPGQGGGFGTVMMIIVGALIALAIILSIIGFVLKAVGVIGGASKSAGSGTALTELLDSAAATYYNGGSSPASGDISVDKPEGSKEEDKEASSDAGSSNVKASTTLHAGWFYADFPPEYEALSNEEDSFGDGTGNHQISVDLDYLTSSKPNAAALAQENVDMWNGERQLGPVLDLGKYKWSTVVYKVGDKPITYCYADIDDSHAIQMIAEGLAVDDQVLLDILASTSTVDDPETAHDDFFNSLPD